MIRDATSEDWASIWPIFRQVVQAGDTYAYDKETTDLGNAQFNNGSYELFLRYEILNKTLKRDYYKI